MTAQNFHFIMGAKEVERGGSVQERPAETLPNKEVLMNPIKANKRWLAPLAALLALALGVTIGLGFRSWRSGGEAVTSLVFLDVNPSIQLQLNAKEEVLAAIPMNQEAREVLADMELKGTSLDVAVNAVMGSLLQHGYLSGADAAILISVEDEDARRAARLEEELNQSVSGALENALVLTQVVDAGTESPATGVSAGKTALIQDIQSLNGALGFDALATLTVEELWQLRDAGAPGMPIGLGAAARAAETCAGTLEVDSVTWEGDPELDERPPHYEIELRHPTQGEFDYKVDAYTGEILSGPSNIMAAQPPTQNEPVYTSPVRAEGSPAPEPPAASGQAETPQPPAPSPGQTAPAGETPSGSIGEEEAESIAFSHAGVQSSEVSGLRCKLDWEGGAQVYEIEFWVGNVEYEYEVAASDGSIYKAEHDMEHVSGHRGGASAASACIGDAAAKDAALRHAGIGEASGWVKCELDRDDGVYEVEFRADGVEYDYEVNAYTGAILKAEQDR